MSTTTTAAEYLFARLRQLGVGAIHGVPGDYNLRLLDFVEPAGLRWVGNANELNAGYAADGYARVKGVGALITTFGVGELSAINAVAGAFTERAALIHIVGTPARASQEDRLPIHHTFNDGEYRRFGLMHAHVTVAQARLEDPRTLPGQVDEVLRQCILHSRPVYIELPVDVVDAQVSGADLSRELRLPDPVPTASQASAVDKVLERFYTAKKPALLVDGETRPLGIATEVQQIIDITSWPAWTTGFGKGLVDDNTPSVYGVYQGAFGDPSIKQYIDDSDLVLVFGPHFSTTNSFAGSAIPPKGSSISFTETRVHVANETIRDAPAKQILGQLLAKLDKTKLQHDASLPKFSRHSNLPLSDLPDSDLIAQDKVWQGLSHFLRPGDILLGETGTAGYGSKEIVLPSKARLFVPVTWLSIGYMLPAAQGAALAQRELVAESKYDKITNARTILFIGDGSFQMTMQEVATIVRHKLNVIIFLINNDGYTIERCIHGLKQAYNDIAPLEYLLAPRLFGAGNDCFAERVSTYGELKKVLADSKLADGQGLRMVEIMMGREDAPKGPLLAMIQKQQALESGKSA